MFWFLYFIKHEAADAADAAETADAVREESAVSGVDEADPAPWEENDRFLAERHEDGALSLSGTVEKGDTAGGILQELTSSSEAYAIVDAAEKVWPLRKIRVGQPFVFVRDHA